MDNVHDNVIIKREKSGEDRQDSEKNANVDSSARQYSPRNAKAMSILMVFFSIFLFLSLISYTPKDFIHTRLSFEEFFGLFTGSDIVKAKVDATQNWLGLIGAVISDIAYNSLTGYSILALPFIIFILAVELFRKNHITPEMKRKAWAAVIISVLIASSLSAFSSMSWAVELSREWYGAVGRMFAGLFSTLLGSFGAMLLFLAGAAFVLVKMTNVKVDLLFEKAFNKGEDNLKRWKGSLFQKRESKPDIEQNVENKESFFKRLVEVLKPAKVATVPIQPQKEKAGPLESEPIQPNTKKQEEPARIIKGSIDIKVNNPRNKMNPVLNTSTEKENSIGNSLVDKLIEENKHAGKRITPAVMEEPEPEAPAISEKLSALEPIKPLEITIDKKEKVSINEIPVNEIKAIKEPTEISSIEGNHDKPPIEIQAIESSRPEDIIDEKILEESAPENHVNFDYQYREEPFESQTDTEPEDIKINPEDYFRDLPDLAIEKPLVVTVKEKEPDIIAAPSQEKLVNPIGTSILDEEINYAFPGVDYLDEEEGYADVDDDELKENAKILQEKLETFKIYIENLTVTPGPVVTQYEFVPAPGIKISRIESLSDDIAMALKAKGIRIIAPIPGKGTVGIEIPNKKRTTVRFKSIITSTGFQQGTLALPLAFGRTISGDVYCTDLTKMPHLLIAGSTGAGKSVGINTIITSLLYKIHPKYLKFVIVDPKKVELQQYSRLESHYLAVSPDLNDPIITDPESAVIILKSLCMEMDRRYDILSKVGQRNIQDYNLRIRQGKIKDGKGLIHREMPYIVVIIDELADLMLTASKEVETPIIRLAQLARAIGIHLVVATQRPSVNVITGIIKANFPARIAYLVASKFDSRTILDMGGAEHLLGQGDMLFLPNGTPKPIRLQNAFLSTEEVERITEHIGAQQGYSQPYFLPSLNESSGESKAIAKEDRDPLFEDAARLIVTHQQGSVSLIQRRLKVGYARAGRIVDELESAGIVGPFDGSKARRVYIETEEELEDYL